MNTELLYIIGAVMVGIVGKVVWDWMVTKNAPRFAINGLVSQPEIENIKNEISNIKTSVSVQGERISTIYKVTQALSADIRISNERTLEMNKTFSLLLDRTDARKDALDQLSRVIEKYLGGQAK